VKLHLDAARGNFIRAHSAGRVLIGETAYTRSLVVLPGRVLEDWPPRHFDEITVEHLALLATLEVDTVVLGTGLRQRFPSPALASPLIGQGIGLEVMDTAAACRTFNILAGDGRPVAAALVLEPAPQNSESTE